MANGRRYETTSAQGYFMPADEKQFECLSTGHVCLRVMDCQQTNALFRSPLSKNAQNVIDLGTGTGEWAIDVADTHSNLTVRGVDLYPPPYNQVPSNCMLEVDDITKPWTWQEKFELVHMRILAGSFTPSTWDGLYKTIYDNLQPGDWIEHLDCSAGVKCDDDNLPPQSLLATMGQQMEAAANKSGRPIDSVYNMRERIERAGFENIHEINMKVPLGPTAS